MYVDVDVECIDLAEAGNEGHCPIAIALTRIGFQFVRANRARIVLSDPNTRERIWYRTPKKAEAWIKELDDNPTTFRDPIAFNLTSRDAYKRRPMGATSPNPLSRKGKNRPKVSARVRKPKDSINYRFPK